MSERQLLGVEKLAWAPEGIQASLAAGQIAGVADERVADAGGVGADLVGAAGEKLHFYQGKTVIVALNVAPVECYSRKFCSRQ